eukprot:218971_1
MEPQQTVEIKQNNIDEETYNNTKCPSCIISLCNTFQYCRYKISTTLLLTPFSCIIGKFNHPYINTIGRILLCDILILFIFIIFEIIRFQKHLLDLEYNLNKDTFSNELRVISLCCAR